MDNLDYDLKQIVTQRRLVGLWRILAGYRWLYLLAIVSIGLSALMRSTIYYALGYYVDNVLSSDGSILRQSLLVGTAVVGLALLQGALTFVSGRSAAKTAEGITRRLRNYLYDHIQRLSFTYHDNMQTGELLQRSTSDVDALRRLFAEQLNGIGNITLLFLVNFVALLMLNVRLALYSVVVIPFIIGVSLYFFKKVGEVYETYQEQEATLSNRLQENLSGVRVVKAFARQSYEIDMFEVDNQEKYRRGKRLIFMHASFWPVTDIMCGIQMLAGFFLGARMAINGIITPGEYLTYAGLVVLIIWPIRNLGRLITQMSTGLVSFDRVRDIIREDREPLDAGTYIPEDGLRGAVQFKNLHFAYDKETQIGRASCRERV